MKTIHILACSIALASVLGAQTGGRSSVEGQVVSGADGTPVRRAAVSLQRTFSSGAALPGQPPRTQLPQPQTETDDQGHFAFHDLEPGGYQVTVQRQGFVAQNGMGMGGPNVQLWLGEGQQLTGYVVRATPQAVIAGKVIDEYGDPVMGAQVYAQRAGSANGGRPVMNGGNVQGNDLGEYRIAGLSAGDYLVATAYLNQNRAIMTGSRQPSPGQPQLVYATTYHPSTAVASEAAPVHVADGAVIGGIDIKLTKISAFRIHVTVSDPGAPQNSMGPFPNLRMRDPSAVLGGGFFGPQRQPDGSFVFTGVPPGSYVLTAQRNSAGAPGSAASASMPIEVRDQNLEGVALEVKPNADLQGAVRYEQLGECNAANMQVSLRPPGGPGVVMYGPMPQPATVGDDLRFTLKGVAPGIYSVNLMGTVGRCYVKSILYRGQAAPEGALTVSESGSLDLTLAPYSATLSVVVVDRDGNPAPRARIMPVPKDGGTGMNGLSGVNGTAGPAGQTTFASLRPGTYDVYAFASADQGVAYFPGQLSQGPDYLKAFEGRSKTVTVPETGRATVEVTAIPASETGATAAPTPAPGAKGSLEGKVVNAVNGSAMAGVIVSLRGQFNTAAPERAPSVTTDDRGAFAFPDLAPGSYFLSATEQRFIAEGSGVPGSLSNQVIVGEGQQVSAYVLKLVPEGVIAGTVKDESGEPVLGARVQAFRYRNQTGQRRLAAAAVVQTDDLGNYRIANLAPGDYYVSVARTAARSAIADSITGPLPSEAETDYVSMWYPNAAQPAAATAVKLATGATAGNIDMTWRKVKVVRIRGKVADPSGGAVGAPMVTLMPKQPQAPGLAVGSARVARDGSFEISAVPAGSYSLIARPGPIGGGVAGAQVYTSGFSVGPSGPSARMAVQSIEVKDASIEGTQLELGAGRTVKGSIKMDGGGPLVRPAFVSLASLDGGGRAMLNPGSDGTFTATGIFPLVYTLDTQNLPANCYVKSVRYAGQEVARTGFELTGDGQLEIVLSSTAAVLEGSVTGADGKPAGGAGIVVAPVAGALPARTGNADAHGNFYFANLPPGEYRVAAWDAASPEANDPPESLGPFARYAKTVTLGESGHEKAQVTVVPSGR
jgi:protocatechuate 3,4-dioxygenase beta subunit